MSTAQRDWDRHIDDDASAGQRTTGHEQAAVLVNAACGTLCTQAPG
jgi:hypothetical protein